MTRLSRATYSLMVLRADDDEPASWVLCEMLKVSHLGLTSGLLV